MRIRKPNHASAISDDGIPLDEPAAATVAATPPRLDDWPARQRARHLGRQLRRPSVRAGSEPRGFPIGPRRFDPPQNLFECLEHAAAPGCGPVATEPTAARNRSRRNEGSQAAAWLIVSAGSAVLAAGIALVAWSLATKQMLYWNLALGLTLSGQGTLIFGLVLVVLRLWRSSRHASGRLQDVHARLGQLQNTADGLMAMRSGGGAPAFYADLVRGASPQVLLANLKGQLDQLATRISGW